ncbi:MFS transporter [Halobacillus halophilus]|uniref:MFS-type transporter n=1 Tax=Halobacillus halophilus (strain ATCC 35676 / DSM 2266 / JCM 20832 / KCTC 3685 / LMG 17431 / NBRC 102448 / NCIMB 2269) TaxID=866895 RepID=I0JNJ1_HALH3|nr:DHA2 family efflux MFS transporter permease subunit [Halobacillus halophilus]ASF39769.1 MFS transporter [Halobacillus halophilus]CCG45711.1 putative MFS-type transporter [Halobacillus halophilus DSM 2266]
MTTNPYNKVLIAALLLAGSFITILNQTLMITAIPPIMDEMNISANSAQWLTTVFMLVNGIMIPISAFLIERFTTRQLFLGAMTIFTLGTVVGGLAPNFGTLLVGRVIQSSGAGVMLPLMQTVFLMIFPINKRGAAMGYIGLVISFAPAIGPALSGWVTAAASWRLLFLVTLPLALVITVLSYFFLRNVTELTFPKVDPLSIGLSSIGFGSLLYGFTVAGNEGWTSPTAIYVLLIGCIGLFLFITRQLRMEHPMLEFRVFKYPVFTISTIIGMIAFMGLIGVETLLPLYMQNMREFTAFQSGLALLPGAIISGFMSPLTGRIFDKIGAKLLALTGLTILTSASAAFVFLDIETTFASITILYSIRMFGLSMVMMPVTTAGLNQLPQKLIAHGAAMNNTMRQVAASVGTAILVTVMTTSTQNAQGNPGIDFPGIYGVRIAFIVITMLSLAGIVLALFVTKPHKNDETKDSVANDLHQDDKVKKHG